MSAHALHTAGGDYEFLGYISDEPGAGVNEYDGAPVFTLDELPIDAGVLVPVMGIEGRRAIYERLIARGNPIVGSHGGMPLAHPQAVFGEGSIVTEPSPVGPGVVMGRGVIATNVAIGHDTHIGDFSSIAIGATIPGFVHIGREVWIGAGATLTNGTKDAPLRIGDGAVVGVGAVVLRDVAPGEVVVAQRSRSVRDWMKLEGGGNPA